MNANTLSSTPRVERGVPACGPDDAACYCPISTRSMTLTVTSIMPTSSGVGGAASGCAGGVLVVPDGGGDNSGARAAAMQNISS